MASFLEDLWNSIFTEGPTPSLLLATNVTFAALELVLIALIFLTFSIHFVILFILAGALWWSINWFVAEIRLAKAEEERTLKGHASARRDEGAVDPDAGGDEMSSGGDGDDTEVEAEDSHRRQKKVAALATSQMASSVRSAAKTAQSATTSASTRLETPIQNDAVRQRQRRSLAESTGSLSTDSEWEKVEGEH